jgi:DNA-binding CsgD family transcriptional regulator
MMPKTPSEIALRELRHNLLDAQRKDAPPDMLDCAAHMLLYLDEPDVVHEIGLSHLLRTFDATRTDLGYATPESRDYVPSAVQVVPNSNALVNLSQGFSLPNLDPSIQFVWNANHPVFIDVERDPIIAQIRPIMREELRVRTKLARRLDVDGQAFGIVCIDQTEESRVWSERDHQYLERFVTRFLAPILHHSLMQRPVNVQTVTAQITQQKPTEAELEVLQLAAMGLSYKEIAKRLGKSPRTVDNQLRSLREKLGVHNQVELIRACAPWL